MSKLVNYPSSLPTIPVPEDIDPLPIAQKFTTTFPHLTKQHFIPDALWRDIFALTGTLRTFHSASSISTAWTETSLLNEVKQDTFKLEPSSVRVVRLPQGSAWIEALFSFETKLTDCTALVSLVLDQGEWRIWILRTVLEGLKEVGNVDVLEPVKENGAVIGKVNGNGSEEKRVECVVIGGGLAGLSTGGRLKALGIAYLILDKNQNVGDNWKLRYGSARLHTNREYGHLPFERTFGPEYQEYLTKDDLAKGYLEWAEKFDINIWQGTTVQSGTWDEPTKLWTLNIKRGEKEHSITTSFVVLAGGAGGQTPVCPPPYKDRDVFRGITMHSAEYMNASQWKGKHGVVVGTANTAHDVANDMLEAGLSSVTMIQRSKTYVMPAEYYFKIATLSYNANKPTEEADRSTLTNPTAVADLVSQAALSDMVRKEPERFDALERAGFKTERYGSIQENILIRAGGHYMDVGASKKIADGLIKMKSDALPVRYTKDGLIFSDGTFLKADVIVFATGFVGNMRRQVDQLFGIEIGEQVGDYWTLDEEGELKGAYKATGHPAIWLHGGTIGQGRYFSRFIALQIKARLLGIPLPLYEKTP